MCCQCATYDIIREKKTYDHWRVYLRRGFIVTKDPPVVLEIVMLESASETRLKTINFDPALSSTHGHELIGIIEN